MLTQLAVVHAQPVAPAFTNQVLELDGTGGCVELPPNIFNDLDEATVEAWVRWDDFRGSFKRVFNYGDAPRDLSITSGNGTTSLGFVVVEPTGQSADLFWISMLRRSLSKADWQVLEGENGRAALEKLNGLVPAAILLDLMMPEMDGFEFMHRMRQRSELRTVPVIAITAKDLTAEDRQWLNGEVARILQKNALSLQELLAEVLAVAGVNQGAGI